MREKIINVINCIEDVRILGMIYVFVEKIVKKPG